MQAFFDAERFRREVCARDDLCTSDPYDIWITSLGFRVKHLYNKNRILGLLPAALLTLFDMYINNRTRWFYAPREYPIVRAWAVLILLRQYRVSGADELLAQARSHLDWLLANACEGYSGPCWGLGFEYAVSANFAYSSNMPLSTMTPYALEALVGFTSLVRDDEYEKAIVGVFEFLEHDLEIMEETTEYLVTSYAAMRDRKVINAVSYTMYSYALLMPYIDPSQRSDVLEKIGKLHAYVAMNQNDDGSWYYSPEGNSFIDCFHSCIVIKNLIKTHRIAPDLIDLQGIERGYEYLLKEFFVPEHGLYKRFAKANKPSLVRFDLYDNAEMLNLMTLMRDYERAKALHVEISKAFISADGIHSQIDRFGLRQNSNTLRWATMPYLYALGGLIPENSAGDVPSH